RHRPRRQAETERERVLRALSSCGSEDDNLAGRPDGESEAEAAGAASFGSSTTAWSCSGATSDDDETAGTVASTGSGSTSSDEASHRCPPPPPPLQPPPPPPPPLRPSRRPLEPELLASLGLEPPPPPSPPHVEQANGGDAGCRDAASDAGCLRRRQAELQAEAQVALAQAEPMARMQLEVERHARDRRCRDALAEMLGVAPSRRLGASCLEMMSLGALQLAHNSLLARIEEHNSELVRCLIERDDLHMEQDAMLVEIEDLTRRAHEADTAATAAASATASTSVGVAEKTTAAANDTVGTATAAPVRRRMSMLTARLRPKKLVNSVEVGVVQMLCAVSADANWIGIQLETLPAGPVLEGSRLTVMCHGPQSENLAEVSIGLNGRAVILLQRGNSSAGTGEHQLLNSWSERSDIVASLSPHFATVRLMAQPADSGVLSCRARFKRGNATAVAGERQLIVGLPPEPPTVQLISRGRQVSWLADKEPFEIRCTGRTANPSVELVVYVSDISRDYKRRRQDVVYTRQLTADPELDGLLVTCVSRNVFGSQRDSVRISVRFISEEVVIGESLVAPESGSGSPNRLDASLSRGQYLTCLGASNPAPYANWSVPHASREHLLARNGLLEVAPGALLGDYSVSCSVHLPTGKVVVKAVRLHVVHVKGPSFAPNVVAILFGVFLAISVLLNALFISLLCKIYKSDETWNAQHQYTHIPIRRWVTKSMT
uniref:SCHIP-1 domain-containing protein n=1 Tax=Macrostomum lignano TaxID=282301 RepID=A0A1I8ITY5_9PLAT